MKKLILVGLAVVAAALSDVQCASAVELEVGQGKRFLTISGAMAAAIKGDTVKVWPGSYAEKVILKRGVRLEGISRTDTRIVGSVDMASDTVLTNVSIEPARLDRYAISVNGALHVSIIGADIAGGDYYSLLESLVAANGSSKMLIYDCNLSSVNANCAVFQNKCRNITIMRTAMTSGSCYRREAKTPFVLKDVILAKLYNNDIRKGADWFPGWVGKPVLLASGSKQLYFTDNIFVSDVANDPWQYGQNGLWIEGCSTARITYNILYQTGLSGIIPFGKQNHFSGSDIYHANNIDANPDLSGARSPAVDAGSPRAPRDPDGTRADIGKNIFLNYDNFTTVIYY